MTKKTTKKPRTTNKAVNAVLTRRIPAFTAALKNFSPPERLTVSEWAEKYRVLPAETAAEPGPWRTSRTPYLYEPMAAFTDPKIHRIVMVAASQVGKSEFELNILGYIMAQDPGSILYIQPSEKDAKKFSRQRIAPMIRDSKTLRGKVSETRARDGGNTILQKLFPGGSLTMAGSRSASDLCSIPCKYIIGDERDRWEDSAGVEGDPWELAQARQITFYNRKAVEVSTPTIAGTSKIESSYALGTMERWQHKCPNCGEWHEITLDNVKHSREKVEIRGKTINKVTVDGFLCPDCGFIFSQDEMRKAPQRWYAENPDAYNTGVRSFWLTAFASPWQNWLNIFQKVYDNENNVEQLKVIHNTMLGRLWEDRSMDANEETFIERAEEYQAELPEGVIALTCGCDTQDDRIEFEVVGWGKHNESWGIKKGFISGVPDDPRVWAQFDEIINKTYKFKDGYGLRIALTFIDSGGHYTQDIYKETKKRNMLNVYAIKGKGGEGIPLVNPAKQTVLKDNPNIKVWFYLLGVDAGKAAIYHNLQVQAPGAKYCHFPSNPEAGYDLNFYKGLLSEKMVKRKTASGYKWAWEKLPGHQRNEALDCRNYAYAARNALHNDFDILALQLKERRKSFVPGEKKEKATTTRKKKVIKRNSSTAQADEW